MKGSQGTGAKIGEALRLAREGRHEEARAALQRVLARDPSDADANGAMGFVLRRNILVMFMSVELMLNAANLALVAAARGFDLARGSGFAIVSVAVAAAEVGVGLAIIIALFRLKATVDSEKVSTLHG